MITPNSEQIQNVIISSDMIEQIEKLREAINDPVTGVEIEPLKIYCQKTGHIIGARDENSLFSTMKISGKNDFLSSLYHAVTLSVHPAWINTSGPDLDRLIEQDPIGYACYCFGFITAQFYQNSHNSDRKRQPWIERYWAMARANALLTQRGIAELPALNEELCKFLTYANDHENKNNPKSYLQRRIGEFAKTPDMLAMLAITGELTELLRDCTNKALAAIGMTQKYINATRFVDYAATPIDNARGPSNIRQQKRSKRELSDAKEFGELSKLFEDSGLDLRSMIMANVPGTSKFRERIAEENAKREADMLQDLITIGGTNLDNLLEEDDSDDNAVEIHTLAVLHENNNELSTVHNETQSSIITTTITQKPMSALERIRANRGK